MLNHVNQCAIRIYLEKKLTVNSMLSMRSRSFYLLRTMHCLILAGCRRRVKFPAPHSLRMISWASDELRQNLLSHTVSLLGL